MVKVWNVADGDGGKPSVSMVASRDLGVVSCFFPFLSLRTYFQVNPIGCIGQSILDRFLA
jgi:hypothetical protein